MSSPIKIKPPSYKCDKPAASYLKKTYSSSRRSDRDHANDYDKKWKQYIKSNCNKKQRINHNYNQEYDYRLRSPSEMQYSNNFSFREQEEQIKNSRQDNKDQQIDQFLTQSKYRTPINERFLERNNNTNTESIQKLKTIIDEIQDYQRRNSISPSVKFNYCTDRNCSLTHHGSNNVMRKELDNFAISKSTNYQTPLGKNYAKLKNSTSQTIYDSELKRKDDIIAELNKIIDKQTKSISNLKRVNDQLSYSNQTLSSCVKQYDLKKLNKKGLTEISIKIDEANVGLKKEYQKTISSLKKQIQNKDYKINQLELKWNRSELKNNISDQKRLINIEIDSLENLTNSRVQKIKETFDQSIKRLREQNNQIQRKHSELSQKYENILRYSKELQSSNRQSEQKFIVLKQQFLSNQVKRAQIRQIQQSIEKIKYELIQKVEQSFKNIGGELFDPQLVSLVRKENIQLKQRLFRMKQSEIVYLQKIKTMEQNLSVSRIQELNTELNKYQHQIRKNNNFNSELLSLEDKQMRAYKDKYAHIEAIKNNFMGVENRLNQIIDKERSKKVIFEETTYRN